MALGATVLLGSAATPALGGSVAAAAAGASGKICVALVVDARSIGSDVSTSCAKVAKGSTGLAVLQAGGHTVSFRNDGLLCTIDGLPRSGCADVNDTHYWAYYHRAPGSTTWVYSSEGAATYEPVNDSTEGWVYDNGTSRKPDNVAYATICGSTTPKSSAAPKPVTSTVPAPPTTSRTPTPVPASATPAATRPPSGGPPTSSPPVVKARHPHHQHRASPDGGRTVTLTGSPTDQAEPPTSSPTSATLAGGTGSSSSGHGLIDLIIVLVIVAGLGGFAVVRSRRG